MKPERAILEANMGGDKKPSFEFFQSGHGKTVLAEATLDAETVRPRAADDRRRPARPLLGRTHGAVASGMQSVAFTPRPRSRRSSPARARTWAWSGRADGARTATGPRTAACTRRSASPARGRTSAAAPRLYARDWLALLDCAGSGKVHRFADRRRSRARARSRPPPQWRRPAPRTSSRRTMSAEACAERR